MKSGRLISRGRVASGFTLMEFMVAMAIASLIFLLVSKVVGTLLQTSQRSMDGVAIESEIDFVFRKMESDLSGLVLDFGRVTPLHLRLPSEGFGEEGWEVVPRDLKPNTETWTASVGRPGGLGQERWGKAGGGLLCFTHGVRQGLSDPGGIYAVHYQIKRKRTPNQDASNSVRYFLMRSEVSAAQTLSQGYAWSGSGYFQGNLAENAVWAPSVIRHPNRHHALLPGVIDFGIRAWRRDENTGGWELLFPKVGYQEGTMHDPEILEVMMRVLTDEGSRLIAAIEQGFLDRDWWQTAEAHSQVHVRQLALMSRR